MIVDNIPFLSPFIFTQPFLFLHLLFLSYFLSFVLSFLLPSFIFSLLFLSIIVLSPFFNYFFLLLRLSCSHYSLIIHPFSILLLRHCLWFFNALFVDTFFPLPFAFFSFPLSSQFFYSFFLYSFFSSFHFLLSCFSSFFLSHLAFLILLLYFLVFLALFSFPSFFLPFTFLLYHLSALNFCLLFSSLFFVPWVGAQNLKKPADSRHQRSNLQKKACNLPL